MNQYTPPLGKSPFHEVYQLYFRSLYNFIAWRSPTQAEAEDLTSQVFLQALQAYPHFEPQKDISLKAWLFRIAKNTLTDFYRKNKSKKIVDIEDEMIENLQAPDISLEKQVDHTLFIAHIKSSLQKLPAKQKEVLTLRLFGELQNKEIAHILHISEKTVATNYLRGIQKLSQFLNHLL